MMPQFFNIKKKHFFLPVRCIKLFFCASFVLNKYSFLKEKIGYEIYKYDHAVLFVLFYHLGRL
jgi:hypothetical protein